ncbi:MAG: hypothetical protein G01um101416_306 [Microgenomates group bacterium Gr01-1014_16]|nr:MAG: hypothetical protein G01um101416_306 [Microgenomates group bacterium Gr01-1014_16]
MTIGKRIAVDFLAAKRPSGAVVRELKTWLLKSLPDGFLKERSEAWWEREQLLSQEDIEAGREEGEKSSRIYSDKHESSGIGGKKNGKFRSVGI